ncbi:hypothetical protein EHS25_009909 [Saitozyma podzolica]|uniref:Uncharacterized protein n=1 Tax=Saitozyma podzolica TaxID=1890683 RepID=A0A427YI25_9TREE|nr:hypothetical protein EHS25_009909 [Saitozyma podzolica]
MPVSDILMKRIRNAGILTSLRVAQSHQPLSSFPPVLERIAHSADTTTRLTLLRTTYQLHHIVGPLIYREVYLDRKALAGVFLGWDVGKSAIDEDAGIPRRTEAATKESKGVIRKLVTTITGCGSRSKAKKQKPGSKHSEETEKAKGWGKGEGKDNEPNEDYKPTRNFKTALLRTIKIATSWSTSRVTAKLSRTAVQVPFSRSMRSALFPPGTTSSLLSKGSAGDTSRVP